MSCSPGEDIIVIDTESMPGAGSSYTFNTGAGLGITGGVTSTVINGGYVTSGTIPYTYTTGTTTGYTIASNNTSSTVQINTDGLTMADGTDITVGGKSLTKAIEQIEERLGILHPNPELEERWDKLKDLRKQYMEMEKDLLEKEKIMKILKEK